MVAAKIVVVVNDQDSGARMLLAIEIRSRESAGTATDDYKVVEIGIGLLHRAPIAPAFQRVLMGDLE